MQSGPRSRESPSCASSVSIWLAPQKARNVGLERFKRSKIASEACWSPRIASGRYVCNATLRLRGFRSQNGSGKESTADALIGSVTESGLGRSELRLSACQIHIEEPAADLWRLSGHAYPAPGTKAEAEWKAANKPVAYQGPTMADHLEQKASL